MGIGSSDNGELLEEGRSSWLRNLAKMASGEANSLEERLLTLLRYTALAVAVSGLIGAVFLLALGLFRQIGATEVEPEQVTLTSADIALPAESKPARPNKATKPNQGVSAEIRNQTLVVYRAKFRAYQRPDNKISDQQIVDFVWTPLRISAFDALGSSLHDKDGKALSGRDALMLDALKLVREGADSADFRKQLAAFRDAKKANVCTEEVRVRTTTVRGWNDYSTNCSNWDVSPMGCAESRIVEEPYSAKVCQMKFPDDLRPPAEQFADAVQRYADAAVAKLAKARMDADEKTARNRDRKLAGHGNMSTSVQLFAGFLIVMFLYLFVAMERHHRSLRALMDRRGE